MIRNSIKKLHEIFGLKKNGEKDARKGDRTMRTWEKTYAKNSSNFYNNEQRIDWIVPI